MVYTKFHCKDLVVSGGIAIGWMCTASCTFILCVMVCGNIDIREWNNNCLFFQIFPCPHHSASLCSFRRFSVRLRRDLGVLHPELVVETSDGTLQYDSSRAYVGHLTGTSSLLLLHVLCSRCEIRNCICLSSKKPVVDSSDMDTVYMANPR